jgi:Domain of unknown function (DUF892)
MREPARGLGAWAPTMRKSTHPPRMASPGACCNIGVEQFSPRRKPSISRYVKRHLFCREEDSRRPSKLAKAAQAAELKAAFEKHESETEAQVERLEGVFAQIDESPRGKVGDAIMGIRDEHAYGSFERPT